MSIEEIKKLREDREISLFEVKELIERKELFEEIKKIQTLDDVKGVLEKILHKFY